MPDLSSDIQLLRDRYTRAVEELHDDYVHTRMLWRTVLVRVRRHKENFTVPNPITGSVTDGPALADKARSSVERLKSRTFKDIVAQFELFVGELLRLWLSNHPTLIAEKALSVAMLLNSKSLAEAQANAVQEAVESTISDKMYGRPEKWLNFLKKNLGARFAAQNELSFIEMKARRDVLEHQNGVIEAMYLEKAKGAARYKKGSSVELTDADVDAAYKLIREIIDVASASAIATLGVP